MGSDLYNKLTDYFKRHIARLRKVSLVQDWSERGF
jgi:hypothetical protein